MYKLIYINQTGDEPQQQDTQANKRTPLLREEVPYQITLLVHLHTYFILNTPYIVKDLD